MENEMPISTPAAVAALLLDLFKDPAKALNHAKRSCASVEGSDKKNFWTTVVEILIK